VIGKLLRGTLPTWAIPVVTIILVAVAPWLSIPPATQYQIMFIAILSLAATGLNLTLGYAGEFTLGQSAIMAVGAYTAGILLQRNPTLNVAVVLVAGGIVGALVGLVSGVPGLRMASWSLAMVTFLMVLLVPDTTALVPDLTGGPNGLAGIAYPVVWREQVTGDWLYVIVVLVASAWLLFYRNLLRSRYAVLLLTVKKDPLAAMSLGIPVYRTKLTVYILASIPAAVAGVLFAYVSSFVSPDQFGVNQTIAIFSAVILGGNGSIWGPLAGTAFLQLLPFQTELFARYALVIYGVLLASVAVLLPGGLSPIARRLLRRKSLSVTRFRARIGNQGDDARVDITSVTSLPKSLEGVNAARRLVHLEVRDVTVKFDSATVLDRVSFVTGRGITALIGPNGSGKTTILNVISGLVKPNSGDVLLGDVSITREAIWRRSRRGLGRTFQTPRIPSDVLVVEAVAVGAAHRGAHILAAGLRLPTWSKLEREEIGRAYLALEAVGIRDVADLPVESVPPGQLRLIEIARALLTEPRVLLLDEPAAGLGDDEVAELRRVLFSLAAGGTSVLLVEHNLSLVTSSASQVIVLDAARVIYDGSPDSVRDDPFVQRAFLGGSDASPVTA
jgi:branched-chain amino acid transport system permease protein